MKLDTIVVALDTTEYSAAALTGAIDLARLGRSLLVLVRALEVTDEFESEAPGLTERLEAKARSELGEAAAQASAAGLSTRIEVRRGEASQVILDIAAECKADMIVLGRLEVTGLKLVLRRNVVARVIRQATCKVLVVPTV